jgi:hypothetical protein
MSEVLAIVNDLSMTVKVGWAVWLVWCFVQVVWYRRGVRQPVLPQAVQEALRRKSSGARRPVARRPEEMWATTGFSSSSSTSGAPEFVASIGVGPSRSDAVDQTR